MRISSTERFGDLPASRVSSTSANVGDITIRDSEIIVGEDKTVEFYSNKNRSSNVNIGSIGSTGFRPLTVTDSTLPTPEAGEEGFMVYNTTSKTYQVWNGTSWESGNTVTATTRSSLSSTDTILINDDGTVGKIIKRDNGSNNSFTPNNINALAATFDSDSNKLVIAYADDVDKNGKVVIGELFGSTIIFETPVVFEAGEVESLSVVYDSNSNKVVIAYLDANNVLGKAIVGTYNTAITFPTPATVFLNNNCEYISTTFDSNSNKVVIAYQDSNTTYGTAIVGTVSGTGITFPEPAKVFESAISRSISATFDSNSNKVVVAYKDVGNSDFVTAVVGTVDVNSISFGSPVLVGGKPTDFISTTFDSNSNKVVIAYQDSENSSFGTAVVGTVDDTSISFGTPVVFNEQTSALIGMSFDSVSQTVVISFTDGGETDYPKYIVGAIEGTSISFRNKTLFYTDAVTGDGAGVVYDPNSNKVYICFRRSAGDGAAHAVQADHNSLTQENFLGFSNDTYAVGSKAKVQTIGSLSNFHTGLTTGRKYYVLADGSLTLTAGGGRGGTTSPYVGLSVSDTQIRVKG
jgi:hypothetical protein